METTLAFKPFASARRDHAAVVLPVVVWLLAVALVDPLGNFPLNDDWSYSLTVHTLLTTGQFTPNGWTSMTLIGQTLWGALFCLPFGFSHTALRVSMLVAGALGLGAFALTLQDAGCERNKTVLATLVFGFNPVYFVLANSFMTDVGFTAASMVATLCFCRYLLARRMTSLGWALAFSVLALSVRQLALYLPMSMAAVLLLERRRSWRAIALCMATLAASVALLAAFTEWLAWRHVLPSMAEASTASFSRALATPLTLFVKLEQNLRGTLVHVGWFAFPVLMWRAPALVARYRAWRGGRVVLAVASMAGVVWFALMAAVHPLPFDWTTINDSGLGPIWLHSRPGEMPGPAALPRAFWLLITLIAVTGAVLIVLEVALTVRTLVSAYRQRSDDPLVAIRAFLLYSTIIYLAPLLVAGYFDRYLLAPTFTMIALVAIEWHASPAFKSALVTIAAAFALVLTSAFTIAATHDYLGWNRARWALLDTLRQQGIAPTRIDGGFEFDGTWLYDPAYVSAPPKSVWWVHDDQYIIQFGTLAGYRIVDSADIDGWLPNFRTQLLVLKREGN